MISTAANTIDNQTSYKIPILVFVVAILVELFNLIQGFTPLFIIICFLCDAKCGKINIQFRKKCVNLKLSLLIRLRSKVSELNTGPMTLCDCAEETVLKGQKMKRKKSKEKIQKKLCFSKKSSNTFQSAQMADAE